MCITFTSTIRDVTYDYCHKQPKSMCEMNLNEIIARNPKLINCLNRILPIH